MISAQDEANSATISSTKNTQYAYRRFDTVIVFGEGPIKPVLLKEELTPQQLEKWEKFQSDPLGTPEPDFFFLQQHKYLQQIERIEERDNITDSEKALFRELKRQEWQRIGWFGMRTMGRQNALAAGYALYKGLTKRVILSGGKTMPKWAKELLPPERIYSWPSEAELMANIMNEHYGPLYEKKYGRSMYEAISIENAAMNTLENFSYTINKYPELLHEETKIGFLSARHHLRRLKMLAHIFSLHCAEDAELSAQELLKQAAEHHKSIDSVVDEHNSYIAREQSSREARWKIGLEDPKYVTYWLGYVGEVKYPKVIQKAFNKLCNSHWCTYAKEALDRVGVDMDDFIGEDLTKLAERNPQKYLLLVNGLQKLKSPEYRQLPPVLATP